MGVQRVEDGRGELAGDEGGRIRDGGVSADEERDYAVVISRGSDVLIVSAVLCRDS